MNLLSPSHISVRNQVNSILVLEKKGGLFAKSFLAAPSLSFSSEPAAGLEGSRGVTHLLGRPASFCGWQRAFHMQLLVVGGSLIMPPLQEGHVGYFTRESESVGLKKRLPSWELPPGFSHRLRPVASFHCCIQR